MTSLGGDSAYPRQDPKRKRRFAGTPARAMRNLLSVALIATGTLISLPFIYFTDFQKLRERFENHPFFGAKMMTEKKAFLKNNDLMELDKAAELIVNLEKYNPSSSGFHDIENLIDRAREIVDEKKKLSKE